MPHSRPPLFTRRSQIPGTPLSAGAHHPARIRTAARAVRGLARNEVNAAVSPELAGYLLDMQLMTLQAQAAIGEPPERIRAQAQLAPICLLPS